MLVEGVVVVHLRVRAGRLPKAVAVGDSSAPLEGARQMMAVEVVVALHFVAMHQAEVEGQSRVASGSILEAEELCS